MLLTANNNFEEIIMKNLIKLKTWGKKTPMLIDQVQIAFKIIWKSYAN